MSDKEASSSASRSRSKSKEDKHLAKRSHSGSRSRSCSHKRNSRSYSRDKKYSHSRSRSHSHRRKYRSRSRSRSYDRRRSCKYDRDYDGRDYYGRRSDHGHSRSRSPMSRRRRHLGDRENPSTSRCLGVFGLSLYTQERDLRDNFERYGPIDDVQIVYDHQTGKSRGFAFLYFKDLEDAVEAKEQAAGSEIDGRKIRVDYSITKRAHTPTPGVYLGKTSESSYRSRHSPYGSTRGGGERKGSERGGYRSYSRERSYSPRRY